ncbi:hypothetical protein DC434_08015 [Microbacterium sp. TPD7012]|nr:hypothetical protein DC434_15870 [Microbacterium sp. TPD7012]PVE95507.1 hypothetical protein DC434_08015 [Microbacterium sp. TPD7012]
MVLVLTLASIVAASISLALPQSVTERGSMTRRTARENGWHIVLMLDAALLLLTAVALGVLA